MVIATHFSLPKDDKLRFSTVKKFADYCNRIVMHSATESSVSCLTIKVSQCMRANEIEQRLDFFPLGRKRHGQKDLSAITKLL